MIKKRAHTSTYVVITAIVFMLLATGIVYFKHNPEEERHIQLKNDPDFPGYVYNSKKSLLAYRIAITIPAVLKAVPCTCGCSMMGHTSNADCFFSDHGFSPHAAHCEICQDISIDTFKLFNQGDSIAKIRNSILKKYETGSQ